VARAIGKRPSTRRSADTGGRSGGVSSTLYSISSIASIAEASIEGHQTDVTEGAVRVTDSDRNGSFDRVLLVEDNPVNQRITIAMLDELGYCVDAVENGIEAVIIAGMVPYRAILMDCQIPTLDGYETTREIRSLWGASRNTPIIAVTASPTEDERDRGLEAGMNGFLVKPVSLERLSAAMELFAPGQSPSDVRHSSAMTSVPPTEGGTPPGEAARPVLDAIIVERLQRLGAEAGEDLIGQLASLFLADAEERIVALRDAVSQGDGSALMHHGHNLCGASANLGAAELSRLCARLTTDGAVVDKKSREELLHAVEAELRRVHVALQSASVPTSPIPDPPMSLPLA
jgi:CheY-like chemotaxis protein